MSRKKKRVGYQSPVRARGRASGREARALASPAFRVGTGSWWPFLGSLTLIACVLAVLLLASGLS